MQNSPLVSVICLCYNHGEFVVESLESVLNQTYPNVELLIADDASSDNSAEVIYKWLEKYPNIPFIHNKINLGNTKTFNNVLKLAKGEFVIDLATDDLLQKDCIAKQINAFHSSSFKNLQIVYGNAELIDEKGQHLGYYYDQPAPSGDIYRSIIGQYNKICSPSSMVKRSLLDEFGGYNESLAYEDLDLWIKTSRKYEIQYIDQVLIKRRELQNSLGNSFFLDKKRSHKMNCSTYKILKNAFNLNQAKDEYKALLKRVHGQIVLAMNLKDYLLLFKFSMLKLRIHLKLSGLL
jgi:glycosyltransferase involved in cell wall biosynthesis